MSSEAIARAQRLGRLQERIARQRQDLTQLAQPLRRLCGWADSTTACLDAGTRYVQQHSAIVVLAGALLLTTQPRLAWRWARRGWFAWQAWRQLRQRLPF